MKKTASVILAKCNQGKKLYGIRIEKREDDWVRTWAFKLQEDMAEKEGFDKTSFSGSFYTDEEEASPAPISFYISITDDITGGGYYKTK